MLAGQAVTLVDLHTAVTACVPVRAVTSVTVAYVLACSVVAKRFPRHSYTINGVRALLIYSDMKYIRQL